MSFTKAQDLIELAKMAHARHGGVTLEEIRDRFQVAHRTAQRMTVALEETIPSIENRPRPDRRKAWKLPDPVPAAFSPPGDDSLEALDFAIRQARESDRHRHARTLTRLRDDLLQQVPVPESARRKPMPKRSCNRSVASRAPGREVASIRPWLTPSTTKWLARPRPGLIRFGFTTSALVRLCPVAAKGGTIWPQPEFYSMARPAGGATLSGYEAVCPVSIPERKSNAFLSSSRRAAFDCSMRRAARVLGRVGSRFSSSPTKTMRENLKARISAATLSTFSVIRIPCLMLLMLTQT